MALTAHKTICGAYNQNSIHAKNLTHGIIILAHHKYLNDKEAGNQREGTSLLTLKIEKGALQC